MKKERLNAITDGVFAIIITIMVLGIKIPELATSNLPAILQAVFIYLVSFVLIAILWINHHHIFNKLDNVSIGMVWLNFLMMFTTSFIPVATERIDQKFYEPTSHVFYGIVLGTTTLIYAIVHQQSLKEMKIPLKRFSNISNWLSTALFFSGVFLCQISVFASSLIYVIVPAFYLLQTFRPFKIENKVNGVTEL